MHTNKPARLPKITLRELSHDEMADIFTLVHIQNPTVTQAVFTKRLKKMQTLGYRVVAAFSEDEMVGISGFWLRMRMWCGHELDIDNFIVHPGYRNRQIGQKLMIWLEALALHESVDLIVLDTYANASLAHRFYFRNGFTITGYHMTKTPGSMVPYGAGRKKTS